jgi:hypothetical protein
MNNKDHVFEGVNGSITVEDTKVILRFNKKFYLNGKPDKVILLSEISTIELKKPPSFFNKVGFIQFFIEGDYFLPLMKTDNDVLANDNAIWVATGDQFEEMTKAKAHIEERIAKMNSRNQTAGMTISIMDELTKAAELLAAGILSQEEFDNLKNKLMH